MREKWVKRTISDLLECSIGGVWGDDPGSSEVDVHVYRQTEFDDDGKLTMPSEAVRSITKSQLKSRALQPGDVLMQKSAGTPSLPGRVVRVRDGIENHATCSNFLQLLRADQSVCTSDFLFWLLWLGHKTGKAFEFQRGTNIRNLDLNQYLIQPVLLPPLEDQMRIVDLLEAVDEYVASLQRHADAARKVRNAVLHELLTAGGEDWVETTLGEVAIWGSGGTPKADEASFYGGNIPWCVIGDLTEGEVWDTRDSITEEGLANSSAKIVERGAIFIAMYGASIGRTGMASRPMATNQAIAFAYPDSTLLDNLFLLIFLQTQKPKFIQAGQGAAQSNISQTVLKKWPILLPPLTEQLRIASIVSCADDLIRATESAISAAKSLRSGLSSDLLSGEHEIPDSYDRLLGAA
jgi:type I restriction enzyme S subunit